MPLESVAANSRPFSPGGKRLDAFDILKGIGILLMIVGHSTGSFASLRNFIFSFHMPLFFLVAGYFFRPLPVWTGIRKNFRRLYVPYLFTALLLALHMMIVAYCHDQDVWGVFLTRLRATLLGSGAPRVLGMKPAIGAIWFLAAMFWSLLWLNLALRTRFPWLVCLLLAALSFYLRGIVFLPQSIQPACSATLFLYVGYEVRRHALLERAGRLTVSGLRQVGRGFRFFPVILFMVRSLSVRLAGLLAPAYLCTDWQPETVVMAGRAGLRAIGNRIPEGEVAAWHTDRGNCKK